MLSRRTLLKIAGLSLTIPTLYGRDIEPKNGAFYLQVNMFGAPSRWLFDLPLFPFSDEKNVKRNMMVGNKIEEINEFKTSLETSKIGGVRYPSLWRKTFHTSSGKGDLSSLFKNMLTIRGCNMAIDGHETNSQKLISPFRLGNSINAQIAKHFPTDFGPLQLLQSYSPMVTTPGAYKSNEGISSINIFMKEDYEKKLFDYKFRKKNIQFENRLLKALAELNGMEQLNEKVFDRKLALYEKEFELAVKKYEKVLNDNYKFYINAEKKKKALVSRINFKDSSKNEEELRALYGHLFYEDLYLEGSNLREIAFDLKFPKLIEKFALTEVIALNNLSSSCLMMLDPPENISFEAYDPKNKKTLKKSSIKGTFDTHNIGAVADILIGNSFFHVFASLLNEFVLTLKKNNRFDHSLIHITSEFDRTPRPDLSGSDHGFQGHTSTLIGGQFNGTHCLGNIYKNFSEESALHPSNGIWGAGAPIKELDERTISYRNISSTVCHLLKIKSITPEDKSLVTIGKNRELRYLVGKAQNV
ncbi:MAG: hypothetical protein ACJAT2_000244 [Bacteriovoracaceae bacterium]|jgi:hypothetical protein